MNDVQLLSAIKVGETVNISTKTIVIHNSYYAAVERWWLGENRVELIKWVYIVISKECGKIMTPEQRNVMVSLIHGLRNLAMTYIGSPESNTLDDYVKMMEESLYSKPIYIPVTVAPGAEWRLQHPDVNFDKGGQEYRYDHGHGRGYGKSY